MLIIVKLETIEYKIKDCSLILFGIFQKYITSGLMSDYIKG